MKVFVIPSWYPSEQNPSYGIFIKEQVEFLAKQRPEWKIGVSTWGQGRADHELWVKDHFRNVSKVKRSWLFEARSESKGNLYTYYLPALSWTKRIVRGNLKGIIRANELNLQQFIVEHGKPSVLWVQASYPGAMVGAFLSSKYGIPYVVHIRFGGFMFQHLLDDLGRGREVLLNAINVAKLVTCTSQFQLDSLGLKREAQVIPNPVDTAFFSPVVDQGSAMVAVGRLEEEKGFDLLIEAMKEVSDGTLTIVGDGSLRNKLITQTNSLGLSDRIHFAEEQDRAKVRDAIQKASFLVLPSRFETFGNVLLEALACGIPVVATDCGGPGEIVNDEVGTLCEASSSSLAKAINQMISKRDAYQAQAIRKYIVTHFSVEAWVAKIEANFRALSEA